MGKTCTKANSLWESHKTNKPTAGDFSEPQTSPPSPSVVGTAKTRVQRKGYHNLTKKDSVPINSLSLLSRKCGFKHFRHIFHPDWSQEVCLTIHWAEMSPEHSVQHTSFLARATRGRGGYPVRTHVTVPQKSLFIRQEVFVKYPWGSPDGSDRGDPYLQNWKATAVLCNFWWALQAENWPLTGIYLPLAPGLVFPPGIWVFNSSAAKGSWPQTLRCFSVALVT